MVERPFGSAAHAPTATRHCSFNPCFGGEAVWTPIGWTAEDWESQFQSLFWWRGRLDLRVLACFRYSERFQSLFWWRGRLDPAPSSSKPRTPCFNPCFGGEAVWTKKRHAKPGLPKCFNPCFGGEAVWTCRAVQARVPALGFQSLFWWRGRLDLETGQGISTDCKFQSLFWWRGRLDRADSGQDEGTAGVSILVLVERSFGLRWDKAYGDALQVSILVLVERPFGPGHKELCSQVILEFQSLFWWRGRLDSWPERGS